MDTKVDGGGRIHPAGSRILAAVAAAAAARQPSAPPAASSSSSSEPPRTLLRGILSQQPSGSSGVVSGGGGIGLVNLHSILQPGHPALRPGDQPSYHPSLAHHPHVKPGKDLIFFLLNWMGEAPAHPQQGQTQSLLVELVCSGRWLMRVGRRKEEEMKLCPPRCWLLGNWLVVWEIERFLCTLSQMFSLAYNRILTPFSGGQRCIGRGQQQRPHEQRRDQVSASILFIFHRYVFSFIYILWCWLFSLLF